MSLRLKYFFSYVTCFLLAVQTLIAQNGAVDSLIRLIRSNSHDTIRCRAYIGIGEEMYAQDLDSALHMFEAAGTICENNLVKKERLTKVEIRAFKRNLAVALNNSGSALNYIGEKDRSYQAFLKGKAILDEIGDSLGLGYAYSNLAFYYKEIGNLPRSIEMDEKALHIRRAINDEMGIAESLNNIGNTYEIQGNMKKSLEYFLQSLAINEKIGDRQSMGDNLANIGLMLKKQGELESAKKYYLKALEIYKSCKDRGGIGNTLSLLGGIYKEMNNYNEALKYYKESLKEYNSLGDKDGTATQLNAIGTCYKLSAMKDSALANYRKALQLFTEIHSMNGKAMVLHNISQLYYTYKDYDQALTYGKNSLAISREAQFAQMICYSSENLYNICKQTGQAKSALEYFEIYITMRDSINNESNRKATIRSQLKYEYEKQAAADSVAHAKETDIKNAELKKQEAEIKAKKNQQYALFGGLALVIIFAGFMFNRWKVTQKQKAIIEQQKTEVENQKHLVEEKQKEILDSIHYAKRIQLAQIPSEKRVGSALSRLKN